MESSSQNSWSSRIRPLIPPVLLHLYREARYGDEYRQSIGWILDRRATEAKEVEFSLPSRPLNELFPGIDGHKVTTLVKELYRPRDMVVPLVELLTLAAICRHKAPQRIFEIGTHTGSSTLVMALNVAEETEVLTLDLEPSEMIGSAYRDTETSSNIRQLYGNSVTFDYTPFLGAVDLIYIDGDHTYNGVKSDTEKAFTLLRPGGVIVWDDYRWLDCHEECVGVTLFLNDFQNTQPVFNIAGTRFAIYVDQASGTPER